MPSRVGSLFRGHEARSSVPRGRLGAFVALTKPRIVELLLVTTLPTMILAADGWPGLALAIYTLIGGSLAAGGANAINMVVDRDIDGLMERTRHRPLVVGTVTPREALVFALLLEAAAFGVLWWAANLLAAALAIGATAFYVFVYTLWLKRTSRQNIVIGGAAGAVPVLVGWAAVTGSLDWPALVLFAFVFLWTPPHFWALAIRHRGDYAAAGVPMLPVVVPLHETVRSMVGYTVAVVSVSLVLVPVAGLGPIYAASAAVLGALFLWRTIGLARDATESRAMGVFTFSISYVTALFLALSVDVLVR